MLGNQNIYHLWLRINKKIIATPLLLRILGLEQTIKKVGGVIFYCFYNKYTSFLRSIMPKTVVSI